MHKISEVESLLDKVYGAVLVADFQEIAQLATKLDSALADTDTPPSVSALQRIHKKAARNAAAILASQRGVTAAIRRLAEVRDASAGVFTYDENGQRKNRNEAAKHKARF